MNLSCLNAALSRALSLVRRAVSERSTAMPILSHVLLEAAPDGLTLAASNLEWHLVHRLPAQVQTPGRVAVPATALAEWVSTLPGAALSSLTLDLESLVLTLETESTTAAFAGMDPADLPLLPEPEGEGVEVEAAVLRAALGRVAFAASHDATHPVLTAVLLHFEGATLTLAATDGYRLSEEQIPLLAPVASPCDVLVPARVLDELRRLVGQTGQVALSVTEAHDRLAVHYGPTTQVSQALAGTFPNYRGVIPSATAITVNLDRLALLGACRRAKVFARDIGGLVRLRLGDHGLIVAADLGPEGESATSLPVDAPQATELQIGFNADYLIDALTALDTAAVSLKLNSARQPGVIDLVDAAGAQAFVHAIMPMQIESGP